VAPQVSEQIDQRVTLSVALKGAERLPIRGDDGVKLALLTISDLRQISAPSEVTVTIAAP
jgi:hypothetical protein